MCINAQIIIYEQGLEYLWLTIVGPQRELYYPGWPMAVFVQGSLSIQGSPIDAWVVVGG